MGLAYMRRFGVGKEKYYLRTSCHTKKKASEIAERIRDAGERARVIRQGSGNYAVYATGKHE